MASVPNEMELHLSNETQTGRTRDIPENSCRQLLDHLLDPVGALLEVSVDLFQRTRRRELIEVPVKRNLEAHDAHFTIFLIALGLINPGAGNMWFHFPFKVVVDGLCQRHVLIVPKAGIGFWIAFAVRANICFWIALTQGIEQGFQLWRTQIHLMVSE